MGVITIDVPQKLSRRFQIASEKKAKELIENLEKMKAEKKKLRDLSDVVGIWSNRNESAADISRHLRLKNNTSSNA